MLDLATREAIRDSVDVVMLLGILGFKISHRGPTEVRAPCLLHGGDNRTAFRMRTDTKRFTCYSRGCEAINGRLENDVFSLVMRVRGIGFYEAAKFLGTLVGMNIDDTAALPEEVVKVLDKQLVHRYIQEVSQLSDRMALLPEVPDSVLRSTKSLRFTYFDDKGVSREVQEFFEVGGMVDECGIQRATIPIRDHLGRLVSISARRTDGDEEPRYLLLRNFKKRRVLYNLHNAINVRTLFSNCLIIVEGFKVVWKLHSLGFMNVSACMGVFLSSEQASLAAESGFTSCLLFFDGDSKGRLGQAAAFDTARKYMRTGFVKLYESHPGMSPDDLEDSGLTNLLLSSLAVVTG